MNLKWTFLLLLFLNLGCFAQISLDHLKAEGGLNRAGFPLVGQLGFVKDKHLLSMGLVFYGPNIVFEKNYPGIRLAYQFRLIEKTNFSLFSGINQTILFDQKKTSKLWFFDSNLNLEANFKMTKRMDFFTRIGAGFASNLTYPELYFIEKKSFIYANYEIAVGIKYHWNIARNN